MVSISCLALATALLSGCTNPSPTEVDLNEAARAFAARIEAEHSPRIQAVHVSEADGWGLDPPSVDVLLTMDESATAARELFCTVIGPLLPVLPANADVEITVLIWGPSDDTRPIMGDSRPCGP